MVLFFYTAKSQSLSDSNRISSKKQTIATIGHGIVGGATFIALNKAWYANYAKSSFHLFNDYGEWLQMDKAGHIWTSYQLANVSTSIWEWTGMSPNKSILLGSISAFAFQGIIEMQDAYSMKWGFSIPDMLANTSGIAAFSIQKKIWKEQKIAIKFQYYPFKYPEDLVNRKELLFGNSFLEQILKDYNGQTYWLSSNLHSFFPNSNFPKWLNVAIGYNGRLMLGGRENIWIDSNGKLNDRSDIRRYRRFFLSADIDLTRIQTNNKLLKNLFFTLNCIKIPFPTMEWNTNGQIKFHLLH